jgi:hypothetical protein
MNLFRWNLHTKERRKFGFSMFWIAAAVCLLLLPDGNRSQMHKEEIDQEETKLTKPNETVSRSPLITDLGPQVFRGNYTRGAVGEENGRPTAYTVITSSPNAKFTVIDIQTEKVVKQLDLTEAEGTWSIFPAKSGKVYIGTYTRSKLFEYDPVESKITDLHGPMESRSGAIIYQMAEDRDGNIYFGVYPESRVFRYDPKKKQFRDLGRMRDDQFYTRGLVYDEEEHVLYAGVGGNRASLIKYDLATGKKTEMLPDEIRSRYNVVYDLNLVENRLFLKMDPNYGFIVMDKKSGSIVKDFGNTAIHSFGVSPKSPYAEEVFFNVNGVLKRYHLKDDTVSDAPSVFGTVNLGAAVVGWGIVELESGRGPEYTLFGFAGQSGNFFKYQLSSRIWRSFPIELPKVPLKLHTLGSSADGRIFSAAFLPGGVGIYNPADGSSVSHNTSQVEGMAALGDNMYFGVYPGARIYAYDTTKPWKLDLLFELKPQYQQDRPYAMIGVPELNKLFIGTVPDYAVSGGALTVYDPEKGPSANQVYRNIVQDQSVVALAYHDGKIYGGTSYAGGMGKTWPYADGKLFVFDIASGQKEYETVPVPGKGAVNGLLAGPDGNIWGFAQGTFFVFDPSTRQITHKEEAFPESTSTWRDPQLLVGLRDGHVYGTVAGRFFRIDKDTKKITVLIEGASLLAQDKSGHFYFKMRGEETNLFRYTFAEENAR